MKKIVEEGIQELDQAIAPFDVTDKEAYAWWLAQTHYYVCHSTRLLALAAARFGRAQEELHYRFSEHIGEEKGHEYLATNDLKAIGRRIGEFEELPETQAFYQTQYYWIEHVDPIAFFGYILCLEAYSIAGGTRMYREALAAHGDRATIFMKVHVQEDVGHLDKALHLVERLPEERKQVVLRNFKLSCRLYAGIYREIVERTSGKVRPIKFAA